MQINQLKFVINYQAIFFLSFLYFIVPFVNLYSSWVGRGDMIFILAISSLLLIFSLKFSTHFSKKVLWIALLSFFILLVSFYLHLIIFDKTNIRWIFFFGVQPFILLSYALFFKKLVVVDLFSSKYFLYIFIVMSLSTTYDYLALTYFDDPSMRLFNDSNVSYRFKPLGIFGQFSVNSTYLIFFYLVHIYCSKKSFFNPLLILLTASILMQQSGVGYVLLLLSFLYSIKIERIRLPNKILGFASIILLIIYSVFFELSNKLSLNYLSYIFITLPNEYIGIFINEVRISSLLTGFDNKNLFPIEITPLFLVSKIGFLYFVFYLFYSFYIYQLIPRGYLKLSMLIMAIGTLHYPVIFYVAGSFLMPAILLHSIYYYDD